MHRQRGTGDRLDDVVERGAASLVDVHLLDNSDDGRLGECPHVVAAGPMRMVNTPPTGGRVDHVDERLQTRERLHPPATLLYVLPRHASTLPS